MSDPTGGNELLVGVKVEREGAQVLPQVTREVVQFGQTMQSVTGPGNGAAAMMFRLGDAQNKVAETAPRGVGGLRAVRAGVSALAFEAAGVPGPVGKIATGLLMFGGGSGIVLGAVAGLGAVALAARALSQDFRDDTAAIDDEIKSVGGLGAHGQVVAARLKLTQLQREREDTGVGTVLKRGFSAFVGPVFGGRSFAEQDEAIKRAQADVQIAEAAAARAFESPREQTERTANVGERAARMRMELSVTNATTAEVTERVRALNLEYGEHYPRALALSIAATERLNAGMNENADLNLAVRESTGEAEIRLEHWGASTEAVTEMVRAYKLELKGLPSAVAAATAAGEKWSAHQIGIANVLRTEVPRAFEAIGQAAIQGFDNVVHTVVGSFVNIVQQLPSITPLQGGLIGLAGSLLGGLFGGGSKGVQITGYDQHALDQLKGIDNGPIRVDFSIFSATTGELIDRVLYEIGQRQRTNPVRRALPGLVFAGG